MAAPLSSPSLLLFIGSEPGPEMSRRGPQWGFGRRVFGYIAPPMLAAPKTPPPRVPAPGDSTIDPDGPRHLPPPEVVCVDLVQEVAQATGWSVELVDVNNPGERAALVARYVSDNDVLPILVRPDGARLEGAEQFESRTVRRFLRRR